MSVTLSTGTSLSLSLLVKVSSFSSLFSLHISPFRVLLVVWEEVALKEMVLSTGHTQTVLYTSICYMAKLTSPPRGCRNEYLTGDRLCPKLTHTYTYARCFSLMCSFLVSESLVDEGHILLLFHPNSSYRGHSFGTQQSKAITAKPYQILQAVFTDLFLLLVSLSSQSLL